MEISKKENYKGQFNIIDTEEKAYFLGYAFGDGHNVNEKGNRKFVMASIKDDLDVFKKFVNIFPFLKLTQYDSHPGVLYLENYEKSFTTDIAKWGLLRNKKKADLENNFNLPPINDNLMFHFIRGFFDADGSVYLPSRYRSRNNLKVEIGLGTENFCLELKEYLNKVGLNFSYTKRNKKAGNNKYYTNYTLYLSSRENSLQFANYIYNNATIFLSRKKKIFDTPYIKSDLQKRREKYPFCPNCNIQFTSNGTRGKKQRLKCKKCNKQISVDMPLI